MNDSPPPVDQEDDWQQGPAVSFEERIELEREELQRSLDRAELRQQTIDRMVRDFGWDEAKAHKFMDLWDQKARQLNLHGDRYWTAIWDFVKPVPLGERQARARRHRRG